MSSSRSPHMHAALLLATMVSVGALSGSLGACDTESNGPSEPSEVQRPVVPNFGALAGNLPSTDTVTSGVPAFEIKQKGGGIAGRFEITNANSAAIALDGVTAGTGHALLAWNHGLGRGAVVITSNSANQLPALDISSQSLGQAATATAPGMGAAADIRANNPNHTSPAVNISTLGMGTVLRANHRGSTGDLAEFQVSGTTLVRFDREGRGYFAAGTKSKGADVAEAFEVEGKVSAYEPGDVLVISDNSDRKVEKSDAAYSTRVIGVYATAPGVLLSEREIDEVVDEVPVGVIGVIPTKVSAENGVIRRGDLLVTARTPGHAMRASADRLQFGMVLGKALEEFTGRSTGTIRVLVNVK